MEICEPLKSNFSQKSINEITENLENLIN